MADGKPSTNAQKLISLEKRLEKLEKLAIVGEIRPMPFRTANLQFGWYHANGDLYLLTSPQGQVLLALPESYKADYGVTVQDGYISLPDVFDDEGYGLFPRPVDGVSRLPGSVQEDAIQEIEGDNQELVMTMRNDYFNNTPPYYPISGPFILKRTHQLNQGFSIGINLPYSDLSVVSFKAGNCVNTATEVRPRNIGFTYAVYLGV